MWIKVTPSLVEAAGGRDGVRTAGGPIAHRSYGCTSPRRMA